MPSAGALTPRDVPQFDVVQAVTPVGTAPCSECRAPIADSYYEWDGRVICATCQPRIAARLAALRAGGFAKSLGLGLAAAAVGSVLYFALSALTGHDLVVVMIAVGFAVGRAVRVGSGGRGGRRYQWLAACLTYAAIASTYVPFVTSGFGDRAPVTASARSTTLSETPGAAATAPVTETAGVATAIPSSTPTPSHLAALLVLAAAAPLLAGFSNVVGIAITCVSVLVAWRLNRPLPDAIAGPFRVSAR